MSSCEANLPIDGARSALARVHKDEELVSILRARGWESTEGVEPETFEMEPDSPGMRYTMEFLVGRVRKYLGKSFGLSTFYYAALLILRANIKMTSTNERLVMMIALRLASKAVEDRQVDIEFFSKVSGISQERLVELELSFLDLLDWNIHVPLEVFESFVEWWAL